MSQYYNARRVKNLYVPGGRKPFRLSRSKIDLFLECPRCFYLDRKLGVARPPGFPFNLNSAVDALLKKEFDIHRKNGTPHPLCELYGIEAMPLKHEKIEEWRDALRGGITFLHKPTNFLVTGGIDDIWVNDKGYIHVVDYKATSKDGEVSLDADWQIGYKRQIEVYQWLFRQNGFAVSDIGYFVYCNGNTEKDVFDAKLEFDIKIIPYKGDDSWVEGAIGRIFKCLEDNKLPRPSGTCDYCSYRKSVCDVLGISLAGGIDEK